MNLPRKWVFGEQPKIYHKDKKKQGIDYHLLDQEDQPICYMLAKIILNILWKKIAPPTASRTLYIRYLLFNKKLHSMLQIRPYWKLGEKTDNTNKSAYDLGIIVFQLLLMHIVLSQNSMVSNIHHFEGQELGKRLAV